MRRAEVPMDRLLVETDAPYLAPVPYRGKSNEPAFVVKTLETLAATKGVSTADHGAGNERQFLPAVLQGATARALPGGGMTTTLTILGCGSSSGVPRFGGDWGSATPTIPKNRRRRCSVFIERKSAAGTTWRSDRYLARHARPAVWVPAISNVDAVLYTHEHADHTHGIDDLRGIYLKNAPQGSGVGR